MDRAELARLLVDAGDAERAALLAEHAALADAELARELKDLANAAWSSEPPKAIAAAAAAKQLAGQHNDPALDAYADWIGGLAELVQGQMERAIERFDEASEGFGRLGQAAIAASTQVPKLIALAMLGRYDEAISTGQQARMVFLDHHDLLSAGKIEQNLGNIYWRRDRYPEAEDYLRSARKRFMRVADQVELTKVENNLATISTFRNDFRSANALYESALSRAEAIGLTAMQAEIECNLGGLALMRNQYDRALDYLERSRRRYVILNMPHEVATVEQDVADAYLELNLAPEAYDLYARVVHVFSKHGMQAEQARALANYARAARTLGRYQDAQRLLNQSRMLYAAEGNTVGAAAVALIEAQLHIADREFAKAERVAASAEATLRQAGAQGRLLLARWVHGEAVRAQGRALEARMLLQDVLYESEQQTAPQIAQRCHTSLGLLAMASGERAQAEEAFKRAVELIEDLRAPLPAEEFRTAFVADKLTPYAELIRLCLADGTFERSVEALKYVERSRSRALLDMLGGTLSIRPKPRDDFEAQLLARITELREDLNWLYSQINRSTEGDVSRSVAAVEDLYTTVRHRESELSTLMRQLQQHSADSPTAGAVAAVEMLDVGQLQRDLGSDTALVEYFALDEEVLAFVVTDNTVDVVRNVGNLPKIEAAVAQFRFQIDALRHGQQRLRARLDQLIVRVQQHLQKLYRQLLAAIEPRLGSRRLVVVPHRELYYVPFHALHDATAYVIERREVCYAPSASVLKHCLARPHRPLDRAVLFGVPDDRTPRVHDEIGALAELFPDPVSLLDEQATMAALQQQATTADVLHLACHGHYRPDNPLFSALRLADGWLSVRDAYSLELRCELVTLSACETGVSTVSPGDELIGLARGFFSAGAPSLLVSLWTVEDEATADLMTTFYTRLHAGDTPAAALRHAQCELMRRRPHPYFWSPFILLGRW